MVNVNICSYVICHVKPDLACLQSCFTPVESAFASWNAEWNMVCWSADWCGFDGFYGASTHDRSYSTKDAFINVDGK